MIIVTGTVLARAENFDEVMRIATEHVLRSRKESGCISHAIFRDTEEPLRLQFVERWSDMAALKTHFAVPESGAMAKALAALTSERPTMTLYEASEIPQR